MPAPIGGGTLLDGKPTVAKLQRFPLVAFLLLISIFIIIFAWLSYSYFSCSTDFDARASPALHENFTRTAMNEQPADFSLLDDEPHAQMCGPFRLPTPEGGCGTFRALAADDYDGLVNISTLQLMKMTRTRLRGLRQPATFLRHYILLVQPVGCNLLCLDTVSQEGHFHLALCKAPATPRDARLSKLHLAGDLPSSFPPTPDFPL